MSAALDSMHSYRPGVRKETKKWETRVLGP